MRGGGCSGWWSRCVIVSAARHPGQWRIGAERKGKGPPWRCENGRSSQSASGPHQAGPAWMAVWSVWRRRLLRTVGQRDPCRPFQPKAWLDSLDCNSVGDRGIKHYCNWGYLRIRIPKYLFYKYGGTTECDQPRAPQSPTPLHKHEVAGHWWAPKHLPSNKKARRLPHRFEDCTKSSLLALPCLFGEDL